MTPAPTRRRRSLAPSTALTLPGGESLLELTLQLLGRDVVSREGFERKLRQLRSGGVAVVAFESGTGPFFVPMDQARQPHALIIARSASSRRSGRIVSRSVSIGKSIS